MFCAVFVMDSNEDFWQFSRIYVDVVYNHMTACHPNAIGVGGCTADTCNLQYPCVPYGPEHFHPPCEITDWNDPWMVSNTDI
jgi:alpha-amylase